MHINLIKENGIDLYLDGRSSRLENALCDNNIEKALRLLRIGSDINYRDKENRTPLMAAAEGSTPEMCQFLIEHGAKPELKDENGQTAYLYACKHSKNPKVLKVLEKAGCNIYARDNRYNDTALFLAAEYNPSVEVISHLLVKGFDPDNNDDMFRYTPVMVAARFNDNPAVLSDLLDLSTEYDFKDKAGNTALMHAAYRDDDDSAFFLVIYNFLKRADPDRIKDRLFKKNKDGKNVMDIAVSNGNTDTAEEIEKVMKQYE